MTELEAEVMPERLERVWGPEAVTLCAFGRKGLLNWAARMQGNVFVAVNLYRDGSEFHLFCQATDFVASLYVIYEGGSEADKGVTRKGDKEQHELMDQFVPRWMPYFRRGCWLSGCPIEATAHEKAEWLNGFTREEIEVWNLKV